VKGRATKQAREQELSVAGTGWVQGRKGAPRRRGLQGFVAPVERDPEPKLTAGNAHLRGAENITQVTRGQLSRAAGRMVRSWLPKRWTSGHSSAAPITQGSWDSGVSRA